jgi:hypothetical protein
MCKGEHPVRCQFLKQQVKEQSKGGLSRCHGFLCTNEWFSASAASCVKRGINLTRIKLCSCRFEDKIDIEGKNEKKERCLRIRKTKDWEDKRLRSFLIERSEKKNKKGARGSLSEYCFDRSVCMA